MAHHRRVRPAVQALLHFFGGRLQKARLNELAAVAGHILQLPRFLQGL